MALKKDDAPVIVSILFVILVMWAIGAQVTPQEVWDTWVSLEGFAKILAFLGPYVLATIVLVSNIKMYRLNEKSSKLQAKNFNDVERDSHRTLGSNLSWIKLQTIVGERAVQQKDLRHYESLHPNFIGNPGLDNVRLEQRAAYINYEESKKIEKNLTKDAQIIIDEISDNDHIFKEESKHYDFTKEKKASLE